MPWLLASPGHQHPWFWLCRMGKFLYYSRKDFNYLCHVSLFAMKNLAPKGLTPERLTGWPLRDVTLIIKRIISFFNSKFSFSSENCSIWFKFHLWFFLWVLIKKKIIIVSCNGLVPDGHEMITGQLTFYIFHEKSIHIYFHSSYTRCLFREDFKLS